MRLKNIPWRLGLIWLAAAIVFFPTTSTYFLQDDWTFLSHTVDKSFWEIFSYHRRAIYRPIGQQLFFWIGSRLFGLYPVGFHLLGLAVHWLNVGLLWHLLSRWPKSRSLAVLWYAIHPIHFVPLNWLTQIDLELAVTWSLLAILAATRWSARRLGWITGLGSYVLALLSHEVALFVPVVVAIWQHQAKYASWLLVGALVVGTKYLINPFPLVEDYQATVSAAEIFTQAKWFMWRGLGVIEGLRAFPWWVAISSLMFPLGTIWRWRWQSISALGVFFFGVAPVLAFSQHPLAAYGTIGVAMATLYLAKTQTLRGVWSDLISTSLVTASVVVVIWSISPVHWTTRRATISKRVTDKIKTASIDVGSPAVHLLSSPIADNREVYFATLEGNQLRVLIGNPELRVTFEAFGPAPEGVPVISL